ncbi:Alkyl sulfatase-like hydrolase [Frankia canadensis]|uniref:Alkyl sulfatase-like hydrolase n=1 Tax=Frankia canadensis TaxID=1836972 RepID=A0A2I2KUP6_9ACTN|nr:SCP2 sterol-binding domain-containing protein [Frankia canadensis]SNQ49384.1 Alkyl sulfatase-like hydrolase [Frankia canadensis]SOU56674.1 Alkyl sulfatase-like hydrolase [Frankia canadensis]
MSDLAVDPTADPARLVSGLSTMSEREISDLLGGPAGERVLDEIFRQMRDTFRPEQAGDETASVRFALTGGPGGSTRTYELRILDGTCTLVTEPAPGDAAPAGRALTITTDRVRFVRVLTGQVSGAKLFLTRKIKVDGDMKFGGKVMTWFGIRQED